MAPSVHPGAPPVVIYASCRRWAPDAFRANMQGFFLTNGIVVLPAHAIAGNFDAEVATLCLAGLPGLALGLLLGRLVDHRIDAERFRKIVLALLLLLGARLVLG